MYMHCWGGRGRAGTLGACLLGDLYGVDAEEALLRVQEAFDSRGDAGQLYPLVHFTRCHSVAADSMCLTSRAFLLWRWKLYFEIQLLPDEECASKLEVAGLVC